MRARAPPQGGDVQLPSFMSTFRMTFADEPVADAGNCPWMILSRTFSPLSLSLGDDTSVRFKMRVQEIGGAGFDIEMSFAATIERDGF